MKRPTPNLSSIVSEIRGKIASALEQRATTTHSPRITLELGASSDVAWILGGHREICVVQHAGNSKLHLAIVENAFSLARGWVTEPELLEIAHAWFVTGVPVNELLPLAHRLVLESSAEAYLAGPDVHVAWARADVIRLLRRLGQPLDVALIPVVELAGEHPVLRDWLPVFVFGTLAFRRSHAPWLKPEMPWVEFDFEHPEKLSIIGFAVEPIFEGVAADVVQRLGEIFSSAPVQRLGRTPAIRDVTSPEGCE